MTRERAIGIACGVGSVTLFSSFTLASRLGLSSSLTAPDIAALRFGIGGTLLLPALIRYGLRGVAWRDAAALAFCGGLGFAFFAYAGFALAPAAHGAILLHGTIPLFTHVVVRVTTGQRAGRRRATGLAVIATGLALMVFDSAAIASARQVVGDGALLLASLCWSAYGALSRRVGLRPVHGAAIVAVFSMCSFVPCYALFAGSRLLAGDVRELLVQAIVQGVLIGAVSIFVYTRAVAALGPAQTALFTAAVPCIVTLAAIPMLSEVPSGATLAGAGAVTLGMVVAMPPR